MNKEALTLALEALENLIPIGKRTADLQTKAITAIKEALAQPEQEPVGALLLGGVIQTSEGFEFEEWDVEWNNKAVDALQEKLVTSQPVTLNLYTTPPQRTWVGLTDEDIDECFSRDPRVAARNAEFQLKEKNT